MPSGPTTGNNSFFTACDAGKWRVPSPAMGMTALRTIILWFFILVLVLVLVLEFHSRLRERGRRRGGFLHIKPFPPIRAEGVTLGAEFNRPGRHALKNVRHQTDAPGKFNGDLRDVFLQRLD